MHDFVLLPLYNVHFVCQEKKHCLVDVTWGNVKPYYNFSYIYCQHHNTLSCSASGDIAALVRSHMNDVLPFESTVEQTTETMPLALKQ